jgi:hypothetical protein
VSHDVRSEKDEIIVDQQQAARKLSSTNPTTCSRLHSFTTLERDWAQRGSYECEYNIAQKDTRERIQANNFFTLNNVWPIKDNVMCAIRDTRLLTQF